jgi:hypothetical protein
MKQGILAYGEQDVKEIESWIGTQVDLITTTWTEGQWGTSAISWNTDPKNESLQRVFGNTDRQLITVLEFAGKEGNNGDYSRAASGYYDDKYRQTAKELIDLGMGDTILRLSPEHNQSWGPRHPDNPEDYARGFARCVREMNSVSGANFTYCFAPSRNKLGVAPETWPTQVSEWPADADVPHVQPTFYDTSGVYPDDVANVTDAQRVDAWEDNKKRLQKWLDFAAERNAPLSAAEWGLANNNHHPPSGGDNPYFIDKAINWMEANGFVFQAYWNEYGHYVHPRSRGGMESGSDKFRDMVSARLSTSSSDDGTSESTNDTTNDTTSQYGGYQTPAEGTLDWHVPVNENFEAIEADIKDLAARLDSLEGK